MSSIDKRYFLHFLDRELLEIHGVYNNCIEKSIIRDMRIILTCSTNTLIIPSAFLFESKFAECIRKEFGIFFANGKIAVSLSYASIKHMIDIKREQFKGYEKDFPNYFDNVPDFYQEGKLLLYPKKSNTTVYIADRMIKSLSNQTVDIKSTVIPYVIDAIGTRENKAITHHLFLRLYERLEFENKEKLVINNLITESYIKSYLEYYNASIFIGLTTGIYQFDSLDNNSPFSNILFWIQLYQKTGLFSFIDSSEVTVINQIINSSEHEEFLKTVEEF
ncbi:MAG: hypothetical protein IKX58_06925, partial [Clostridia bacterium]|nr:hypothetical protein [Clostridia bacterium]